MICKNPTRLFLWDFLYMQRKDWRLVLVQTHYVFCVLCFVRFFHKTEKMTRYYFVLFEQFLWQEIILSLLLQLNIMARIIIILANIVYHD